MGLCKCPKKKVTNLFCFEHRVNVCEYCLVSNHPRCIVQSYLQWLQDSDYDPRCSLCSNRLDDDDCGECVRLTCYDVFHWRCLDNYARTLPSNTAPAGYTCPVCKTEIFPANNVISPVAEKLRDSFSTVNWARAGLGLPLIEEAPPPAEPKVSFAIGEGQSDIPSHTSISGSEHYGIPEPALTHSDFTSKPAHSVVNVQDSTPYSRTTEKTDLLSSGRRLTESIEFPSMQPDYDEDKYKRRPALQWLTRWFGSRAGPKKNDPNARRKRVFILLLLATICFLTIIVVFSRYGRASADKDPFLDPLANPNIHVNKEESHL